MYIFIKAKPGCKFNHVAKAADGTITVKIKTPATDGKANTELLRFIAEKLDLPRSKIRIVSGLTSSFKKIEIDSEEKEGKRKLGLL